MDFVLGPVENGRWKAKRKNGNVKAGWKQGDFGRKGKAER
jgi:hypothetical protein